MAFTVIIFVSVIVAVMATAFAIIAPIICKG
jgi:hypothetical protein